MNEETKKILFSIESISTFILILVVLVLMSVWGAKKTQEYVKTNRHQTILLRTLPNQEYARLINQEYIAYVEQDFSTLIRNKTHCDMDNETIVILKEKRDSICHIGVCHIEIGCIKSNGDFIKYYDS
jgi:hypothetical protein